jgi:2-polyprenyl-6-methoxyphenol hydroxylase-like FAD-dependent oxidoreductase
VGINLAIQDAVAAANILAPRFAAGAPTEDDLAAVQARREWPTRMTQRMQLFLQKRVISRVLGMTRTPGIAWPIRLMQAFPLLRRIPARLIGMGFRPEHLGS